MHSVSKIFALKLLILNTCFLNTVSRLDPEKRNYPNNDARTNLVWSIVFYSKKILKTIIKKFNIIHFEDLEVKHDYQTWRINLHKLAWTISIKLIIVHDYFRLYLFYSLCIVFYYKINLFLKDCTRSCDPTSSIHNCTLSTFIW